MPRRKGPPSSSATSPRCATTRRRSTSPTRRRNGADNPGNELIRATGEVVAIAGAAPPQTALSLDLLGSYSDPEPADAIADPRRDYQAQYAALRTSGDYRNRVYGRIATDREGSQWLQYWFFYFYNDTGFLGFGAHEGDWEMIQLRLGGGGEPDVVVYAQHSQADARPWSKVDRDPGSTAGSARPLEALPGDGERGERGRRRTDGAGDRLTPRGARS